ncbi:rho GTPase-activating protein 5-like isoform X2 [Rhodamnia argentea]|uniref:Rho GTPase-activating protein 5-like isoform X2 n=1 Tax=Rhodamnia argentea TaxID=178133 RepID=A0A8B8QNK5_9MYRT|nr:rho GTPase-activating protein 5-like isoform X2 [Rhodamnia argentea]
MTDVLHSPSHFPSPTSSSSAPCAPPDNNAHHDSFHHQHSLGLGPSVQGLGVVSQQQRLLNTQPTQIEEEGEGEGEEEEEERERGGEGEEEDQLSVLALLVAAFRKSLVGCSISRGGGSRDICAVAMEIGVPTDVRHVAHVTFDRFDGFLGLPVEFEPEVPRRAPSASTTVFGVSTESMQLSFDSRGNSVPTILLLMQRHLYAQGGLQAEGIFRINADNGQEECVREQLNRGVVPDGIDVHCLAGLIKAWFRELPSGVLDSLSPEQVMQSQSEEDCAQLVMLLPPMQGALFNWAINLMADVAQFDHLNKMNARNVAVVFAPNMTKMADPLTALMYAVQVMNFLRTLIEKTLRERGDSPIEYPPPLNVDPSDGTGPQSSSVPLSKEAEVEEGHRKEELYAKEEPAAGCSSRSTDNDLLTESEPQKLSSIENIIPIGNHALVDSRPCEVCNGPLGGSNGAVLRNIPKSSSNFRRGSIKVKEGQIVQRSTPAEKANIIGNINPRAELREAWR